MTKANTGVLKGAWSGRWAAVAGDVKSAPHSRAKGVGPGRVHTWFQQQVPPPAVVRVKASRRTFLLQRLSHLQAVLLAGARR